MDGQNETILLDVKLDPGKVEQQLHDMAARLLELKDRQAILNQQIRDGNDVNGKYAAQLLDVKNQISWVTKEAKSLSATTKLLTADTLSYGDSLNEERRKLSDMQKAYDSLDREQRESEGGKAFLASIKAQHDAVLELEGSTGRMQRNVGNYGDAVAALVPGLNNITKRLDGMKKAIDAAGQATPKAMADMANGFKTATVQALKFIATPVGAFLAAFSVGAKVVSAVFDKLKEAFRKNDDAMTGLQRAFAAFQPIATAVGAIFDRLAVGIARVAEGAANLSVAIFGKVIPGYKEQAAAAQAAVTAQDNLEEAERQYTVNSADRQKRISKLRAMATDSEKYSLKQRQHFMRSAIAYEQTELAERKKNTAEKLRLLELEAKRTNDTSDEMKNKIAQSRAEMFAAEKAYYDGVRTLQKQLNKVNKGIVSEEDEAKKEAARAEAQRRKEEAKERQRQAAEEAKERKRQAAEAAKERQQAAKAAAAEEARIEQEKAKNQIEIQRMAEDFALSIIQDADAKAVAQRKLQGEREIAQLQERLNNEKTLTDESRTQLAQLIKDKQAALDAELEKMATDAANKREAEQVKKDQEAAARILEYKLQLAADGSEAELELQKAQLALQMEQALANTELTEEEKYLIRETFEKKAEDLDKQYADNLKKTAEDARKQYKESLLQTASNASSVFKSMGDLLNAYGEQNEKAAAASKAFGVASIVTDQAISIANTAKAITEAVAGATAAAAAGGPAAPFLVGAYIAGMVGAVLGAVASVAGSIQQAKSLMSQADTKQKSAGKYAGGGVVPGTSYTGDKLTANVNSAEVISNPRQAANLLYEISNNPARGGFDYAQMAAAVAAANAALPAPVLNYSEFEDFNKKRVTYNEIAAI